MTVSKTYTRPRVLANLAMNENIVYDVLRLVSDDRGVLGGMSRAEMARICRMSERELSRCLRRLEAVRLLIINAAKRGRGAIRRYVLRPLYALWVRFRNAVQNRVREFSTDKGAPLHKETPERLNQQPKDGPGPRSPGAIMAQLRAVVSGNIRLPAIARRVILSTAGRMLFHEGQMHRFTAPALHELIDSLRQGEPSGMPSPDARSARFWGWARIFIGGIVQRHAMGIGTQSMLEAFMPPEKTSEMPTPRWQIERDNREQRIRAHLAARRIQRTPAELEQMRAAAKAALGVS